ncbi:MAG TPA: EamA family transporter [Limnochordia bacterium]|nr:EamA family transporter [Limnochordia bacterium]
MSPLALALVLSAALLHAGWNLLAKKAGGGAEFVWLVATAATLLYAPLVAGLILFAHPQVGWAGMLFIAGSAVLHVFYFTTLQAGYRAGPLSLVYPLARGVGPALASAAAVAFFGERMSGLAAGGVGCIVLGAFVLSGGGRIARADRAAFGFGVLTGVLIASYTLWDRHAVAVLGLSPLLYDWACNAGRAVIMLPVVRTRRKAIAAMWRDHRAKLIGIGLMSPLAYILVLTAMSFTPVSYVAPAREISILFGTLMGTRLLAEGDAKRRMAGATAMVLGIFALALG